MKTTKSVSFNSIKKYYYIILVVVLVFFYFSSSKQSNIEINQNSHELYSSNDSKKTVSINLFISGAGKIKVNDHEIMIKDFEKEIEKLTNKYSPREVSGFKYNVYADGSIKKGFITDLFERIRNTQSNLFGIERVLHLYKS